MKFGQIEEREFKKTIQTQFEPIILPLKSQKVA